MYLSEDYGDCIDLKRTILWKEPANTDRTDLVFRSLNVEELGMFPIRAPKFNSCDSRKLDLDKRHPFCLCLAQLGSSFLKDRFLCDGVAGGLPH